MVAGLLDGEAGVVAVVGSDASGAAFALEGDEELGEGGLITHAADVLFNTVAQDRAPPGAFRFDGTGRPICAPAVSSGFKMALSGARLECSPSSAGGEAAAQRTQIRHTQACVAAVNESAKRQAYDPTKLKLRAAARFALFVSYAEVRVTAFPKRSFRSGGSSPRHH